MHQNLFRSLRLCKKLGQHISLVAATLLFAICVAQPAITLAAKPRPVEFNRDIRPLLSDRCFHCHGPADQQNGLRLDREKNAKGKLSDGEGLVIDPGKAETSALIKRIFSDNEDELMPPPDSHRKLSAKEKDLFKRWIAEGAVWEDAWSYIPPKNRAIPKVKDKDWVRNWIDNFILRRLETEEIKPSPDADRVTLIRRLYIDLTGIPPTPAEVKEFVEDKSDNAYEKVVDRLLKSHQYGERMAIYWLDLVRFADTVGYHGDQDHSISPYRDYVIEAFNDNMPFDRMTREHLAGDLLPNPTLKQKIATGYNRMLQTSHEGGVQAKEYLAIYAADRVRNLSGVWMGATMGCSSCHDHKFDPYTMKDFYSMEAFFADVDERWQNGLGTNNIPTERPPEIQVLTEEQEAQLPILEDRREELMDKLKEISPEQYAEIEAASNKAETKKKKKVNFAAPIVIKYRLDMAKITTKDDKLSPEVAKLRKEVIAAYKDLEKFHNSIRRCMITVSIKPRTMRILPRGNWMDDTGAEVEPAVPEFLGKLDTNGKRATRLDLANWLTDAKDGSGGLTARVMANRFWYLLFGRGLARVLDDFGGQGEAPTHPELLDQLAQEFVKSGWDVKHMMKFIVMSRTYQQASIGRDELEDKDPLNELCARQSQFRFPAEVIRDSTLFVSGLLVDKVGGPSVKPYQPAGYYKHLNFPLRDYAADTNENQWRRGLYTHWQRQFLHPMLKAFDAPMREECTAQRARSNTPLAALVFLNDPTFIEASRAFATRIVQADAKTTHDKVNFAFQEAVSHDANAQEQELLVKLFEESHKYYSEHEDEAEKLLKVGLKPVDGKLNKQELAAWTIVARTVLSLSETTTRK